MEKKYIVVHPAQQHAYFTSRALQEKGILECFITSSYYKKGTLIYLLARFLNSDSRNRIQNRRIDGLDDKKVIVICEISSIIELLSQRIERRFGIVGLNNKIKKWHNNRFNKKTVSIIKKYNDDGVISYDNYSQGLFDLLEKKKIKVEKLLDMSAPAQIEFQKILLEDPHVLNNDIIKAHSDAFLERVHMNTIEIAKADVCICASHVTENSVLKINPSVKCVVCRYGVDANIQEKKDSNEILKTGTLKIVFIGTTNLFKGFPYLVEALNSLNFGLELHCYGLVDENYKNKYCLVNSKIVFHGHVPQYKLLREIPQYDLMIFPSLCDGFGFGALESILAGIPVIMSDRTGISELFLDSIPNVVYNAFDVENLKKCILMNSSKARLVEIQEKEERAINYLTWSNYSNELYDKLK